MVSLRLSIHLHDTLHIILSHSPAVPYLLIQLPRHREMTCSTTYSYPYHPGTGPGSLIKTTTTVHFKLFFSLSNPHKSEKSTTLSRNYITKAQPQSALISTPSSVSTSMHPKPKETPCHHSNCALPISPGKENAITSLCHTTSLILQLSAQTHLSNG